MASYPKGFSPALNWIAEHVSFDGPDCLIWPFSRMRGYPNISTGDGKTSKAHRRMCELVNGPPPTILHEAAHSCGNGDQGCIHPKHLAWKTRAENQLEAVEHGTAYRHKIGSRRAKLTPQQAIEIRSLKGNLSQDKIAARFNISNSTVAKIHRGELWTHVIGDHR